jgi:hypothetical protein
MRETLSGERSILLVLVRPEGRDSPRADALPQALSEGLRFQRGTEPLERSLESMRPDERIVVFSHGGDGLPKLAALGLTKLLRGR